MGHRESRNSYDNKNNNHKASHKKECSYSHDKKSSKKYSGTGKEKASKYDEKGIKHEDFRLRNEEELWNLPWDQFKCNIKTLVKLQGVFENEDPKTREERRKKNRRGKDDDYNNNSQGNNNNSQGNNNNKDNSGGQSGQGGKGGQDNQGSQDTNSTKDGRSGNKNQVNNDSNNNINNQSNNAMAANQNGAEGTQANANNTSNQSGQDGKGDKDGKDGKGKKPEGPKEKQVAFRLHIYEDSNGCSGVIKALHLKQQKYIESYNLVYFEWLSNSRLVAVFKLDENAYMELNENKENESKACEYCKCDKCGKCCTCCECSKHKKEKKNRKNRTPEYLTVTAITRMYDEVEPQVHIYTPGVASVEIKWGGHLLNGEISSAYRDCESYVGKCDEDDNSKMLYSVKN